MKPAYAVKSLDLSVVFSQTRLTDAGQVVESVTIQQVPAGSSATLILGQNSDQILLAFAGQTFNMCPGCDEGIYVVNPIAAAGTLIILVGFGGLTSQVAA